LEEVIKIFKHIQETSSLNEKKAIISENKNNELFKKCLRFLLDGNIVTGMSTKKINKKVSPSSELAPYYLCVNSTFEDVINYLEKNNTGRDDDIYEIQSFLFGHEDDREFYEQMITKSFRLGIDSKTVNKCISGLIPSWEVQLGSSYEKLKLKDGEWFSLSQKLNGCFDGNTYITMYNNSKKKIKDIKVGDIVKSFDEKTHEIVNRKVINVFDNGLRNREEWMQIETRLDKGIKTRNYINVTKNHKIFTPKGWIRADNLKIGDEIFLNDYELSKTQKAVLLGIGLGDGNVIFDNREINVVRFSYPKKINKYSNYLHNTCNLFDIYTGNFDKRKSGYGTYMEKGNIKTIYNIPQCFKNQNNILRSGYTFTDEILRNMTELSLAIYYIDDGSKTPCKDDGAEYSKNVHPRVTLATHRHNKQEVERFSKYLYERYNITNKISLRHKCYEDSGYQIEIDVDGTCKLFDIIAKYIPYEIRTEKLSKKWHNIPYEDWTKDFGKFVLVKEKIENINSYMNMPLYKNGNRKCDRAYDLEIEGTHTYFANDFAVHNCRASFYQRKLISRQGKEFTGMQHIISDLEQLGIGWFYDGELIRKNIDNLSDGENFRIGTGIINSDAVTKEEIKFVIFDYFPESEVLTGQSFATYKIRRNMLNELRNVIKEKDLQNIEIVTMVYEGTDRSEIMKWLDFAVDKGWEGLMLNKDASYKCKRTTDLIKIKRFYTMDLPIVEVLEGDGRLKGTLGALVVQYKDNTVNVGSGFDDETRAKFWKDKDDLIGRIVEVKYKEISKDKKTGLESLQFPIYIGLREKGKKVSYD